MTEKVIGMLGGMGPEATLDCYRKIINQTPAEKDQDHLRVIIDSNPKTPDRTAAVLGRGESPTPLLVSGINALERAGADFVIIPCISAHVFLAEIRPQVSLPILSIFDAVAQAIVRDHPGIKTVGLLSTTGTMKGGLFQERLSESGLDVLTPTDEIQETVMQSIYTIKAGPSLETRAEVAADLAAAGKSLVLRGAEGIIAGCTEIPLALKQKHLDAPYFDSLLLLARAAIRRAGLEPR